MYVGCSFAISTITGGLISYKMALVLIVVAACVYTVIGGMRAVVITDAMQWVLVLITLVAAVVIIAGVRMPDAGVVRGFRTVATNTPRLLGKVMPDKVWMEMFILILHRLVVFSPAVSARNLGTGTSQGDCLDGGEQRSSIPFSSGSSAS